MLEAEQNLPVGIVPRKNYGARSCALKPGSLLRMHNADYFGRGHPPRGGMAEPDGFAHQLSEMKVKILYIFFAQLRRCIRKAAVYVLFHHFAAVMHNVHRYPSHKMGISFVHSKRQRRENSHQCLNYSFFDRHKHPKLLITSDFSKFFA